MSCENQKIAVIGGGVSGVAAAHYLLEAGYCVDLFEANNRLGGRVCVDALEGREVCFGGKNIGFQYNEFRGFLGKYSTPQYEYFGINSARLVRGNIKAFNPQNKIKSLLNILEASSPSDLVKLFAAMKAVKSNRSNGDLNGPYFRDKDKDIASNFSPKLSKTIIRALTVRMNGAEPSDVSMENFGTHLQMLQDEYEQLQTPLSDVFDRFTKSPNLSVFTKHSLEVLKPEGEQYSLTINGRRYKYKSVVLALPANATSQLLASQFSALAQTLEQVRYYTVGVIIAKYKEPVFSKDVRALTFGETSPLSNIGAYGIHDLNMVRYTFSGQAAEEILHETLDDDSLMNTAEAISAPYFNIANNQRVAFKTRYWSSGLCGYTTAEAAFQKTLKAELSMCSGVYLTGDYIKGASIENCFRASKAEVGRLITTLKLNATNPELSKNFKEADYV